MARRFTFTDRYIDSLKSTEKEYWKREGEGFAIRVLPSGVKVWYFIYTFEGRKRFMKLGAGAYPHISLSKARELHGEAIKLLANGTDPMAAQAKAKEEHRKHPTIKLLVEDYLNKHAKEKKTSWKEDERILNKDVVPVWGDRKTKDITRRDVLNLLDSMRGRGDGIITNTFKIIRRMFRFAVKQEIITATPCYGFEKGEELPRPVSKERTLSDSEIKAFLEGIDSCAISTEIRSILKLILLTGQRPGEVCSMHADEIDGRWWEFTPKETKITRETPRRQRIYLTNQALALIGEGKDYKFPSPIEKTDEEGNPIPTHITERAITYALRRNLSTHTVQPKPATWKKATVQTKSKKPFVVPEEKKLKIEKFTPHDLRRTCATKISEMGFVDAIVDAVLAHLKKGEIRTYNKNKYDREKQKAMETWERKLKSIVTGKKSNVVAISSGKKAA